jgi:hypothetical protein
MTTNPFQFHYRKHKYTPEKVDSALLFDIQNYNPLYSRFFDLNETNYNQIQLNQTYFVQNIIEHSSPNHENNDGAGDDEAVEPIAVNPNYLETIIVDDNGESKHVPIFVKYSPLLDPIRYLSGKYDIQQERTMKLPNVLSDETMCDPKLLDSNNASYVDGFFSYLTSKLLHNHGIVHGIDYYGSYLCKQREFSTNVFDDIEYLVGCEFFNKHENDLFTLDYSSMIDENSHESGDEDDISVHKLLHIRKQMKPFVGDGLKDYSNERTSTNRIFILDDISQTELGVSEICSSGNDNDTTPVSVSEPSVVESFVVEPTIVNTFISEPSIGEPSIVELDISETSDNIIDMNVSHQKYSKSRNDYNSEDDDDESSQSNSSNTTSSEPIIDADDVDDVDDVDASVTLETVNDETDNVDCHH